MDKINLTRQKLAFTGEVSCRQTLGKPETSSSRHNKPTNNEMDKINLTRQNLAFTGDVSCRQTLGKPETSSSKHIIINQQTMKGIKKLI